MNKYVYDKFGRQQKLEECARLYNIDIDTVIHIDTENGYIEVPYLHLLTQPPEITVKRKWERWVRKIINIAAKNNGWKLIHKA